MLFKKLSLLIILSLSLTSACIPQSVHYGIDLDTVKAQRFDMGKMWMFENPPLQYFQEEYNFIPTNEWLEKVQKSALKFAQWCSASFVSEDGLVMTNHHCARGNLQSVAEEGEDLLRDGFFAASLDEERRMPGIFVEQLLIIEDVTDEVKSAASAGKTDQEIIKLRDEKIAEIEKRFSEQYEGLRFKVTSLYHGGKYSLYGYKRYDDVRLVFAPDLRTAKLGGDYDNFTYPRYGLDCTFFRVYDDEGKPLKTQYYFKWSRKGVVEDDVVFVVGNPGSTNRLNTMAQIEFLRDVQYPMLVPVFKELYDILYHQVMDSNAEDYNLIARLYSIGNGLKVYEGTYKGLLDPYLLARKKDFENQFRSAVNNNPDLKSEYGHIWNDIQRTRSEAAGIARKIFAYNLSQLYTPIYYFIARDIVKIAEQLKLPEDERMELYKGDELKYTIESLFPLEFDEEYHRQLLAIHTGVLLRNLDPGSELIKKMFNGKAGPDAVDYLLSKSKILSADEIIELFKQTPDNILKSDDPFIYFIMNTQEELAALRQQMKSLQDAEAVNNKLLGEALFAIYGDSIPPDATFTLRLADGIVKGYDYNGTRAPVVTTFYGVLDRYYSFNKQFPFNLPEIWENLPEELQLHKPLNFISTNDIIGGNSGSAVINKNAEIVGLAFDGNIESLPNNFIYTTEANRTINVHSEGMIEAISNLYKAKRVSDELLNGKLSE